MGRVSLVFMRLRSIDQLAEFVDRVGIAVVWGKADLVLPSAWQGIAGPDADWAMRDENGKPTGFTPEFERLWRWKDELPERRLACAGRHFGSAAVLIAPRLVADAYALRRVEEEAPLEREITQLVDEQGPLAAPEMRELLGTGDKKGVDKAITALQRRLVLTNAGVLRQDA